MGRSVIPQWFVCRSSISVLSYNLRAWHVSVSIIIIKQLLLSCPSTWTHCLIWSLWNIVLLSMEARNLKLVEFNVEKGNEIFEHVSTLSHQFGCLLISQSLVHILIWPFKIWEKQNENFFRVARNLNKIDWILNLMEVSIEYLALLFNSIAVVSYIHWRRALLGNNIQFGFFNSSSYWAFSCASRMYVWASSHRVLYNCSLCRAWLKFTRCCRYRKSAVLLSFRWPLFTHVACGYSIVCTRERSRRFSRLIIVTRHCLISIFHLIFGSNFIIDLVFRTSRVNIWKFRFFLQRLIDWLKWVWPCASRSIISWLGHDIAFLHVLVSIWSFLFVKLRRHPHALLIKIVQLLVGLIPRRFPSSLRSCSSPWLMSQ